MRRLVVAGLALLLAACGGGGGGGGGMPAGVAPTITMQPANASVTAGTGASFVVAATGTAPLAYQWQRNGVDIGGATAATFTIAATSLADNGASFRAVVSNASGSATSNAATLAVAAAPPVLTITTQPANVGVVAGASASFTVAATCSSGTLGVQWQRGGLVGGVLTWTSIAGATTTTTTALVTVLADSGAQFRAQLDCSGLSAATSTAALLTVTAPMTAQLALLPVNGLRDHAEAGFTAGLVQDAAGSFTFLTTNRIKRLSADLSTITPVAGGGAPAAFADGPAATARFNAPLGLAQDPTGVLYVADTGNHLIRKVALDGTVTTVAGSPGVAGLADGTGGAARFSSPWAITMGPDGDLYVADRNNSRIRRVTTAGVVTTYAGSVSGYLNGAPLSAQFVFPEGVVAAPNGDLYVSDYGNLRVRVVTRSGSGAGSVSTLAGSGMNVPLQPDGLSNVASIPFPSAIALRGNTLIVADEAGLLRLIDITSGVVSTLTGFRAPVNGLGYADGPVGVSRLRIIRGIVPVASGGYLVADDNSLRTVSTTGVVTTISTTAIGVAWTASGIGVLAQEPIIMGPSTRQALTVDPAGNVVIADFATNLVRRIAPSGAVTLAAGLSGNFAGAVDGKANEAQFARLGPVATDPAGAIYVTDNYAVRRIGTDNVVTLVAGSYTDFDEVNGSATTARFFEPNGVVVGPGGNIFVADHRTIRKIDTAGNVTTYAGAFFQAGIVDGPAASARFQFPTALAFAPDGTLYVQDGSLIRRVSADGSTVSTTAINDVEGGLAVDSDGTLYYGSAFGLAMVSAGGTRTLLIPKGPATVLGASPTLLNVISVAVLGPKRLVIQTGFDRLIATLP